jgi:hypothetical protein
VIERFVARVRGRQEKSDARTQLLEMCEMVQHATHVWGSGERDTPLCVNPAVVDYFWRAVLVLVRDSPSAKDDGLYRYALENLEEMARQTLLHAAAGKAERERGDE